MNFGQLGDKEKTVLEQFREATKDCVLPDANDDYLLRWLIARDFDLIRAEKMLRDSMEWRRHFKVDGMLDNYKAPEVLARYFTGGHIGVDKQKNYLIAIRYGAMDLKGILRSAKKRDYLMHVIGIAERCVISMRNNPDKFKQSPDAISQLTIIFDMDGFSMRHITYKPGIDTVLQLLQVYEANYPELLRRVFVINAPKVFAVLYSMMKPLMHEKTANKVHVFSNNSDQWKAALLEDIDPQELPACYGGTLTDPDGNPNCVTMFNIGGEVPKSYYLNGETDVSYKKLLSIARGSKEQLQFQIAKPNSVVKWDFHSEDGDIAFAVYREKEGGLLPIVPHERVDCHLSSEEGEMRCDYTGVYVVEFDNSFSYLRSKKIWYSISIESVNDQNGIIDGDNFN
ncbi:SEC14-like protein 2 [Daphnia carinata]|uniref:SEC14-like protein 2 n=1 Tax=Daphnia carinata TaxID=120202 RepID=UPI00257CB2BE|nr:SEC14-like protein 2 [Daphnia carinata]